MSLIQLFGSDEAAQQAVAEPKPVKPFSFLPLLYAFDYDEMESESVCAETPDGNMFEVATVWTKGSSDSFLTRAEAERYAKLFSAASDMYAAIIDALDPYEGIDSSAFIPETARRIEKMRDAIVKAEGRY